MKNNTVKESFLRIRDYVLAMPPKKRKKYGIILGSLIVAAVALAVVLNMGKMGYRTLYSNMEAEEASSVYELLQEMGAKPQMSGSGEILVPAGEYDNALLKLAAKGYPQSALPYDLFASHSGLTTTESEKKQWLLYQLQDRIQETLKRIDGVDGSTVTINMPETSDYVWQQATNEQKATAGILLSLKAGKTLTPEQVSAVKTLVASSVPNMAPADVAVVDARTMVELQADDASAGVSSAQNLNFEQTVQKQIENNVVRVLTPRYGLNGVVAVAKVTINYDKMMTERMEMLEKTNPDGTSQGYLTHNEGQYSANGTTAAGNVVGEENNTDIPQYAYNDPKGENGITDYTWGNDYDYGYLKTQIEKGNAVLDRVTVSVMVNDTGLTQAKRTELIGLISKSVDVPAEEISVSSFEVAQEKPTETRTLLDLFPTEVWVALGAGLVILLILTIIIILLVKRGRKKKLKAQRAEQDRLAQEEEARRLEAEQQISAYKKQLADTAASEIDPKGAAIVEEVRTFANDNPEITASLLRSWLKEDN